MDWLEDALKKIKRMPEQALEVRQRALADLSFFARLVNPGYVYGSVHDEIYNWLQDYNLFGANATTSNSKFVMLPRAHLKSHMVAVWCAWIVTRHPEITILYISATAELADTQLYAIKNILDSAIYQRYFPEYINPQEGAREKWTATSIIVDHPKRKLEGIRDATIKTAGLTTNTTGWHCDILVADDLVVPENAYTEEGRNQVLKKSSQFTSILNPGGFTLACGTRYHPSDAYATWKEQAYEVYDEEGIQTGKQLVWDIKEYPVEKDGIYLWPRRVRDDGKAYGFDRQTLAVIRAKYNDRTQFYAQYYNDPNDPSSDRISRDKFQYYNPRFLRKEGGNWFYNDRRLNVYAAVDFAFSLSSSADYTAIVVIGIDSDSNIFILDIDRFKADKTTVYFEHIKNLHAKWKFKKLHAEVTVAQKVIVNDIKSHIRSEGMVLSVEDSRPTKNKEERIASILEHRYDHQKVWHFEGGWTDVLEDELVKARPAHDDIKDSLASAIEIATPPVRQTKKAIEEFLNTSTVNKRFGGITFK